MSPVDINDATNVLILLILFLMLLDSWRSPVNFQVIYESDIMEAAVTSELQLLDVLTLTFKLQARILQLTLAMTADSDFCIVISHS